MRQRNGSGSVVLDRRIKTWNFFFWENGKRRSKKIGTVSQFPTKASAWQAAKPLRDAVYRLIARNRYKIFGKYDACMVPDADLRARVIE